MKINKQQNKQQKVYNLRIMVSFTEREMQEKEHVYVKYIVHLWTIKTTLGSLMDSIYNWYYQIKEI